MNTLKPLILVTNDDGVSARTLSLNSRDGRNRRRFSSRSRQAQSGMGHAITTQHLIFKTNLKKMMYRGEPR
jgi:broad specificity polyphosphatase/5'/3'-nucleotidase SurE